MVLPPKWAPKEMTWIWCHAPAFLQKNSLSEDSNLQIEGRHPILSLSHQKIAVLAFLIFDNMPFSHKIFLLVRRKKNKKTPIYKGHIIKQKLMESKLEPPPISMPTFYYLSQAGTCLTKKEPKTCVLDSHKVFAK